MGMAGGAYQGDKERAQLALQAMQIANQRRAQEQANARQEQALALQEQRAQEESLRNQRADDRADRALDIQEENNQLRADQQNAALSERSRRNDIREMIANARQQATDRRLSTLAGQNNMLGQFEQVCDAEQKQTKAKQARGQATMASMMKMGMIKGGTVPMAALNFANRQFGFDGKNQAIGAAGFMSNGNFFIDFLQKDQQSGQIVRNTQTFNYEDMGRVMYSQAGIFNNEDRQKWREGMQSRGYSTEEINAMSGLNATMLERLDDAGRQRLDAGYADPSMDGDWKAQYQRRRQEISLQLAEQKLAKTLGQKGLTDAQKYAMYHFNEFASPTAREATEEDVTAGRAKKVGEQIWELASPDVAFKKAVEFYNKNAQNADPATNPGAQGGGENPAAGEAEPGEDGGEAPAGGAGQPPPVTTEDGEGDEAEPGANAGNPQANAPQAPVVSDGTEEEPEGGADQGDQGEGGAPAPTVDDGQGELDFGEATDDDAGEAPEDGGEAPADGGDAGADGGEAPVDAGGGEGSPAPVPAPASGGEPQADTIASAAGGGKPEEKTDEEDDTLKNNPFAKWVKRGRGKPEEKTDEEDDTLKNNPFAKWIKRGRGKHK